MPRQMRTLTVTIDSAFSDEVWGRFVTEITDVVEQAGCDYAATCEDDHYTVHVTPSPPKFSQPFLAWIGRNWEGGATFDAEDLAGLQDEWTNNGGLALDELHRRLADPAEHAIEQSLRFGYDPEQEPPPTCIVCGDPMEYVQLSPIGNARGWLHTGPKHHDHEARPVPQPVLDCVAAGTHLTSCDSDGYCNACGHQEATIDEQTNEKEGPVIHTNRAVYTYESIVGKEVTISWWRKRQEMGGSSGITEEVSGKVIGADDQGLVLANVSDHYVKWDYICELSVTVTTTSPAFVAPRVTQ